ncbi:MAG: transglutaminase [Comamonadaceae bacterium CG2_30_59_20]|nr:MAG: transglutaminase [Comamonadaceae bacterium CG2_30_59_20]
MKLPTLSHLPRDTRDTLFVLAVIAWVLAPLSLQVPLWCSLLSATVIVWRAVLAWRGQPLPSRWWLLGLLLLSVVGTLISFKTILGRDAGVTLVVVLLALKTLELRARRDAFVVFFLGFFLMLTNFFYSQSLLTAAAMLVGLLGLLTALVNAHMPVGKPPLWQAARMAGGMALLGAPIMVLLFVLFPRVAPLWGLPSDAMSGRSGLSADMTVGNIASLALDNSVAMRVRFEGAAPVQSALYFRGPVLTHFDGRSWRARPSILPDHLRLPADLKVAGEPVRYQVTLEPNKLPWLLLLDATPQAPALAGKTARMTRELQWILDQPVTELLRYDAVSYPRFQHGPLVRAPGLQEYLALPNGFNPRTLALAAELQQDPRYLAADNARWVAVVLERLRSGGYRYTLEPGVYGQHSADEFWFDRKLGFCEHIASSFVILMRALNVPARIVTGYQGGEKNTVDDFWTVRQSDAHAWTEVWLPGQGWQRVDPTSAVAPARTGTYDRLTPPRGVIAEALFGTVSPALALNLRAAWDAVNNRWNQWVLNYSQSRQLDLLKNIGFKEPNWQDLIYVLCAIVVTASLLGAAWSAWERHQQDPWLRLLQLARRKLKTAGVVLAPNSTPRQIAQQLQVNARRAAQPAHQPDRIVHAWCNWLIRLEALRYAPTDVANAKNFKQQLIALHKEFKHL